MRTVTVVLHNEDGTWWAESPDVPGWSAAGDSVDDVRRLAEEGVPFALDEAEVHVVLVSGDLAGAPKTVAPGALKLTSVGAFVGTPTGFHWNRSAATAGEQPRQPA